MRFALIGCINPPPVKKITYPITDLDGNESSSKTTKPDDTPDYAQSTTRNPETGIPSYGQTSTKTDNAPNYAQAQTTKTPENGVPGYGWSSTSSFNNINGNTQTPDKTTRKPAREESGNNGYGPTDEEPVDTGNKNGSVIVPTNYGNTGYDTSKYSVNDKPTTTELPINFGYDNAKTSIRPGNTGSDVYGAVITGKGTTQQPLLKQCNICPGIEFGGANCPCLFNLYWNGKTCVTNSDCDCMFKSMR